MNEKKKICPLQPITKFDHITIKSIPCVGSDCAWWTRIYTTEDRLAPGGCAISLLAQKNAEGKLVV